MKGGRRVIAVVTGTRAEFGLLAPVMEAIARRKDLRLRTIVAGAHWISGSWKDVAAAGFEIDARVRMQKAGVFGRAADVQALSRGVSGIGAALGRIKPDVTLVLGDRIEALAGALAAGVGGHRLAHLHGGDRAEGVADEAMRHAISKLAHLHFPATATSAQRLRKMGEAKRSIFRVGSPAMDGLRGVKAAADAPCVIVLQHPIGAAVGIEERWMDQTLDATSGLERLVMMPNGDPGREGIVRAIRGARVKAAEHLPRGRWLELLAGAGAIVGNSSAGLIEAAALGVPCVNIGPRQAGRERAGNVIDCDYEAGAIGGAIKRALGGKRGKRAHPYGDGKTGERIAAILSEVDLEKTCPLRKRNAY